MVLRQKQYPPVNWNAVPLVPVVLALGAGVLTARATGFANAGFWLTGLLILLVLTGLSLVWRRAERWYTWATSVLVLLLAFTFGGWRTAEVYLPGRADFFAHHQAEGDILSGEILDLKLTGRNMRLTVGLKQLLSDSSATRSVSGRIHLMLPPNEAAAELKTGDGIVFSGKPYLIAGPRNPGVRDLREYWHSLHVHHQLYLRADNEWEHLPSGGFDLTTYAEGWRRAWLDSFRPYLNGDRLAVAAALVLGDRSLLTKEIQSAYTETGAVHVLAVSGLHVGIIFLLLNFVLARWLKLDRTRKGKWFVAIFSLLCIWGFALLSGFSASVQRAAIMFTILTVGKAGFRRAHVFNTLALAALIMIIADPFQLYRVGFQLSFAAIIGIVAFANEINRWLFVGNKWVQKASSAVAASTGAQLGTLPLSLMNFGQFPTYFLVSGTVVVVSAFATMALGVAHGLLMAIPGLNRLGFVTGFVLDKVVFMQNAFIYFFQELPGGLLRVPHFGVGPALLLMLGIACLAAFLRWRRWAYLTASALLFVATFFWARTQVPRPLKSNAVAVYHTSKNSIVDITAADGRTWSLGKQPEASSLDWSVGPRRKNFGLEPLATFALPALPDTSLAKDVELALNHFTVGNSRWLILDGSLDKADIPTLTADVTHVLITNDFRDYRLPEMPSNDPPLFILDGSIPRYRHDKWRRKLAEAGADIWITGEQGAYIYGEEK